MGSIDQIGENSKTLQTEQNSLIGLCAAKLHFLHSIAQKKVFCPLSASRAEFC